MRMKKIALWIVILICIVCIIFMGMFFYVTTHLDTDEEISGPIRISPEWLEIKPNAPLKPSRQIQEIVLILDESLILNNNHLEELQLANGKIIDLQVQILDQYGNTFDATVKRFPQPSRYPNGISCQFPRLPQDRVYRSVRLKSDVPIQCNKVIWHCHTLG